MRGLTAAGVLCLVLSGWLIWIKAPISGGANPSLSFGWLAGVIGGVAGIAWLRSSGVVMAVCGIAGLGLVSFSLLYLAFMDPAFWDLVDENAQAASIISFSQRFLPGNFGIQPTFRPDLAIGTPQDRLATALYFMSWGWVISLAGSLSLLLAWALTPSRRGSRKWMSLTTVLIFTGQVVMVGHSLAVDYLEALGNRSLALGRYAQAVQQYERAQRWSPQFAKSERGHLRIGEAYDQLAMSAQPQARFYLGDRYSQLGDLKAAMAAYLLASQEASEPLKAIVDRRIAWTYATQGMAQYRKDDVGPAIGHWERAILHAPSQIQAAYFLAKAYFDEGRYEQSLAVSRVLLTRSRNRLLNANIQANIGDTYWKLHDFKRARMAYEASMRLDSYGNFRIFKSLGGT
jgi:tetratricopeptide (TPR) repeat protein